MSFRVTLLCCLFASALALAQTKLTGAVTDNEGAPIQNAYVIVHGDSGRTSSNTDAGPKEDVVVRTDDNGSFAVEVPAGFYDVFVSALGFSPDCRKVRIKQVSHSIRFRLKIDPLVAAEFGHTITAEPQSKK
jgi:hypothetical protein